MTNWAKNQMWHTSHSFVATSVDELKNIIRFAVQTGLKITPVGTLHSWSLCQTQSDIVVRMHALCDLVDIDPKNNTITVEAGMSMRTLQEICKEHGMAIPSMPNIDTITIGGAISNGTHGTNRNYGSTSDYVEELEMLVQDGKDVKTIVLNRHSEDPEERHLFSAAVVNFGSLGIITKVKLKTIDPQNMLVQNCLCNTKKIMKEQLNLVKKFDCFMLVIQ